MTEPNNPLFEDEKEFLERKKLEYERALRGDVEEIKEQTIQVSKVALVGAGVVGGIWLLAKAFGGRKHKPKKRHKHKKDKAYGSFDDYAGFDGYEDDSHDQELYDLEDTYQAPEYAYDHANRFAAESDGFYQDGGQADQSADYLTDDYLGDDEDNGLSDYPDFPAHSSSQHGTDGADDTTYGSHATGQEPFDMYQTTKGQDDEEEEPAHSYASANSYQARPYDDSRRMPESDDFDENDNAAPAPKKSWLVPTVVAFAQSETGKVVLAQVAAVAMAFISSKVKDILPSNAADADKNTDLAASTAPKGASPEAWPATSAAQDVSAAAQHDDTITYREPLA